MQILLMLLFVLSSAIFGYSLAMFHNTLKYKKVMKKTKLLLDSVSHKDLPSDENEKFEVLLAQKSHMDEIKGRLDVISEL